MKKIVVSVRPRWGLVIRVKHEIGAMNQLNLSAVGRIYGHNSPE